MQLVPKEFREAIIRKYYDLCGVFYSVAFFEWRLKYRSGPHNREVLEELVYERKKYIKKIHKKFEKKLKDFLKTKDGKDVLEATYTNPKILKQVYQEDSSTNENLIGKLAKIGLVDFITKKEQDQMSKLSERKNFPLQR